MRKVSLIFGTRPEAIKPCLLVLALRKNSEFEPHICVIGKHHQMLDQVLNVFEVVPDVDLDLMEPDQTLAGLTSQVFHLPMDDSAADLVVHDVAAGQRHQSFLDPGGKPNTEAHSTAGARGN